MSPSVEIPVLPEKFTDRMSALLGPAFQSFLECYSREAETGLRINTLKAGAMAPDMLPFDLEGVEWERDGYYYPSSVRPALHPLHDAGVYYIQEPSAMAAARALDVSPGMKVLDMCAAPGGKSGQIAAALKGEGVLISNEVIGGRSRVLSQNIERMGVRNAVVLNRKPSDLREVCSEWFDRILVDAPCSGEGMFRKNPDSRREWSEENVRMCAVRQLKILEDASCCLRASGRMVYSTCTFSEEENEGTVEKFLRVHPEFDCLESRRLYPHTCRGEGAFYAVLFKSAPGEGDKSGMGGRGRRTRRERDRKAGRKTGSLKRKRIPEWERFREEFLTPGSFSDERGILRVFGTRLYYLNEYMESMDISGALRAGILLGELKNGRFEPSHTLAMALTPGESLNSISYPADSPEVLTYLKGGTIADNTLDREGWCLFCVDGFSLGWARFSGGVLKNHYPKGLRRP